MIDQIQRVCEICIEFDQHVEANGRNLQQITANLQWNTGREVGWAIVIVVRSFCAEQYNKNSKAFNHTYWFCP